MSLSPRKGSRVLHRGIVRTVRAVDGNCLELQADDGSFVCIAHVTSVEPVRVMAAEKRAVSRITVKVRKPRAPKPVQGDLFEAPHVQAGIAGAHHVVPAPGVSHRAGASPLPRVDPLMSVARRQLTMPSGVWRSKAGSCFGYASQCGHAFGGASHIGRVSERRA